MIGIGVILDKSFELDLSTLSKLNFYVFVPALLFIKILNTNISLNEMINVALFSLIHLFLLFLLSICIFSITFFRENRKTLVLGTILTNVGNYGIPLILFAFGESYLDILAIIIMVQSIMTFTIGPLMLQKERKIKNFLKELIKIPALYAIIIAFVFNSLNLVLIDQFLNPITIISDGLISLSLITLGIQLSRVELKKNLRKISGAVILRLIFSPIIAIALLLFFNFSETVAMTLIVAAGFPSAVNSYILALEYNSNHELASQLVFWTTFLSAVSIPVILIMMS